MTAWTFAACFVADAPCGVPEWAWMAYGYKDGAPAVGGSGRTEGEALRKCRMLARRFDDGRIDG